MNPLEPNSAPDPFERPSEILKELGARHPESRQLITELSDAITGYGVAAEKRAVHHQGAVVMAAMLGDLTAWPEVDPAWDDQPPGYARAAQDLLCADLLGRARDLDERIRALEESLAESRARLHSPRDEHPEATGAVA